MSDVKIKLAHYYEDHAPGDVVVVDEDLGKRLVEGAIGVYADDGAAIVDPPAADGVEAGATPGGWPSA